MENTNTKILENNSLNVQRNESFYKRWGISSLCNKTVLKNRCLSYITSVLDNAFQRERDYRDYENSFLNNLCMELSLILGIDYRDEIYDDFSNRMLHKYLVELDLNVYDDYAKFMLFMESLLNYPIHSSIINMDKFALKIAELLRISNADVKVIVDDLGYSIYPSRIDFLDGKLVFDSLSWLDKYSKVKEHFSKAVKMEKKQTNFRTIIDELRLSLELLFKELFLNDKSLENQKNELGKYLENNNISVEIRNVYIKMFDFYTTYNNEHAKHNSSVNCNEVNYLIYLTGTFIFLIIEIETNKKTL